MIKVGSLLNNRFTLEAELAQGGMGKVYKALDKRKEEGGNTQPYVALKLINNDFSKHPQAYMALQQEASQLQQLTHPNIVRVYDFDRHENTAYFTMEYLEGISLETILKNPGDYQFSYTQKIAILKQVATALNFIHQQGTVHADLKPSNIIVSHDLHVKIIDFGLSSSVKAVNSTFNYSPEELQAYSLAYASKNILLGNKAVVEDDIYSFACIVYELLLGTHPFQKNSALVAAEKKLAPQKIRFTNGYLVRWLERALQVVSTKKPASLTEFINLFDRSKKPNKIYLTLAVTFIVISIFIALKFNTFF